MGISMHLAKQSKVVQRVCVWLTLKRPCIFGDLQMNVSLPCFYQLIKPMASMDVHLQHDIKISRNLAKEIDIVSNGKPTAVVKVDFVRILTPGDYTLLLNDKYHNYIMLPMTCKPVNAWFQLWKSHKLQCIIEKNQIRQLPKDSFN